MPTTPVSEKKPRKIRSDAGKSLWEYYVTKGGIPCRLDTSRIICKRPVLVVCKPGEALFITGVGYSAGKRKADRLIVRAEAMIAKLSPLVKSPLYTPTERMTEFVAVGEFTVVKRRIAAAPPA